MEEESNELEQQITQRMNELPADVQNAILNSDVENKIIAIGTASKLHLDQIQNLHNLTLLSILGFMPLQDLEKEVQGQLEVPADAAAKIAADINSQILLSIRESMKKFAAGQRSAPAAPAPAPAAPSYTATPKPPLSEVLPKGPIADASVVAAPLPSASTPTPVAATPAPAAPAIPSSPLVPEIKIDMHPADIALTQKTVATPPASATPAASPTSMKPSDAKAAPPKPTDYKADPYREPTN